MIPWTLRPARKDESALAFVITEEAMRGYVEQLWGGWDEAAQREKHRGNFDPATHRLILVDGAPVGLLAVEDFGDHLWLGKLFLRAAVRGRGLGTAVLERVIAEAAARGLPVQLRVLRVNTAALRLYRRHGFRVVAETPERLVLRREHGGRGNL